MHVMNDVDGCHIVLDNAFQHLVKIGLDRLVVKRAGLPQPADPRHDQFSGNLVTTAVYGIQQ